MPATDKCQMHLEEQHLHPIFYPQAIGAIKFFLPEMTTIENRKTKTNNNLILRNGMN